MFFRKKKRPNPIYLVLFLVSLVFLILGFAYYEKTQEDLVQNAVAINVAVPPLDASSLMVLADEKKFFLREGINLNITDIDFGLSSINELNSGEIDLALMSDAAIATAISQGSDISVLGTVHTSKNNVQLLGRKSHGVDTLFDLEGKTIGVIKNDVGEYFLSELLEHIGLTTQRVTVVYHTRADLEEMLISGELDAIVLRRRYIYELNKKLGEDAFLSSGKDNYAATYSIVVKNSWKDQNVDLIEQFFVALHKTAASLENADPENVSIVSNRLAIPQEYLTEIWPTNEYKLSTDYTVAGLVRAELEYTAKRDGTTERIDTDSYFDYTILDKVLEESTLED